MVVGVADEEGWHGEDGKIRERERERERERGEKKERNRVSR